MSKTKSATTSTRKSSHNYDYHESDQHDELSDELSISSSEDDVVATRKSRKLQPTDAADYEEGGGIYDRGGRRRRRSGSKRRRSRGRRSRSRRRRR
ncbi:uncharacterized protein LOC126763758 [Bactrocera neohumeralis]|uniref:uncharacterized protein LOC120776337 n=1 Tax=Bactrocera tryoni TaxID=59916 RepID=UPI001A9A0D38|nr:uncharacterized protein LOC120776337 [Bactrocera tryoni]XP_050337488.1 uncharacterized protein LOC126763758 [Bactrocera neohumeralis]